MKEIAKDIAHEIREIDSGKKAVKKFGIIFAIILFIVAGLMWSKDYALWPEFAAGGVAVALSAFLMTGLMKPIYYAMTVISIVIGYFVSKVVLALIFFLLFAPVGIFARILGLDLLNKKIDRKTTSYWIQKEKTPFNKDQYEKLF